MGSDQQALVISFGSLVSEEWLMRRLSMVAGKQWGYGVLGIEWRGGVQSDVQEPIDGGRWLVAGQV